MTNCRNLDPPERLNSEKCTLTSHWVLPAENSNLGCPLLLKNSMLRISSILRQSKQDCFLMPNSEIARGKLVGCARGNNLQNGPFAFRSKESVLLLNWLSAPEGVRALNITSEMA